MFQQPNVLWQSNLIRLSVLSAEANRFNSHHTTSKLMYMILVIMSFESIKDVDTCQEPYLVQQRSHMHVGHYHRHCK